MAFGHILRAYLTDRTRPFRTTDMRRKSVTSARFPRLPWFQILSLLLTSVAGAQLAGESLSLPPPSGRDCPVLVQGVMASADQLLQQSRLQDAQTQLQQVPAKLPRSSAACEALTRHAAALEAAGRYHDALLFYESGIEIGSNDFWTQTSLLGRTRMCVREGCIVQAREAVNRLITEYPDS